MFPGCWMWPLALHHSMLGVYWTLLSVPLAGFGSPYEGMPRKVQSSCWASGTVDTHTNRQRWILLAIELRGALFTITYGLPECPACWWHTASVIVCAFCD
jgi:hypothetical protein